MVMQIFHIKLSLEATKNIFINSLEEPAFRGLLRYEKRGLGLHYFQQFVRGGGKRKPSSKIQMHLQALLNEFMTQSLWNTVGYMAQFQLFST